MGDPITWYLLDRTVDDPESIKEAIDAKLLTHNQDPSAHGQSGEGLFTHRVAALLDHVNYSIYNIKQAFQTRTVKAFVGKAGVAEFADIQTAIDYVNLHGGGKVFVKAGIYYLDDNVILKDNVELEGEGQGITILDFTVSNKRVVMNGTYALEEDGTYSITQNTKTVTGAGTDFLTNFEAGMYLLLEDIYYEISSVDNDTQITLRNTYRGPTINNAVELSGYDFLENVKLEAMTVQGVSGSSGSLGSGVDMDVCRNSEIISVVSRENSYYGFSIGNNWNCRLQSLIAVDNTKSGFNIGFFQAGEIVDCFAYANGESGFRFHQTVYLASQVMMCEAAHNADHGYYLVNGSYYYLIACTAYRNQEDGFKLAGADRNRVEGCSVSYNAGWGINVSNVTCDRNIILGNHAYTNTAGQIQDLGTNTEKAHNVVL